MNWLEPSSYCVGINCTFTFCITKVFGYFRSIMARFEFVIPEFLYVFLECSPMARETWVQSQVKSYQRLKKMVLDASLLNTQRHKVRIKGKLEQSRERSSALTQHLAVVAIEKGAFLWRCPWCNGYRRRKWTRRHEFKSWTRLTACHIALIPLGKVWIQLFSLQLWVNSRADWVLQPWWGN